MVASGLVVQYLDFSRGNRSPSRGKFQIDNAVDRAAKKKLASFSNYDYSPKRGATG